MKKYVTLFIFCFVSNLCSAQVKKLSGILKDPEVKVDYYDMVEAGGFVLYLPMSYGKSDFTFLQENVIQKLEGATIARVDLVYSDYPSGQDFSLLSKKRIESLNKLLPALFDYPFIEFRKIRQTIAKTKKAAEGLQHGFFVYFRPKSTKEETRKEIVKLKESLKDIIEAKDEVADSLNSIWCGTSSVMVDTTDVLLDSSYSNFLKISASLPRTITRWSVKDYIKSGLEPQIILKDYEHWDSVYHVVYGKDCPITTDFFLYQLTDTTVTNVLKRHNWSNKIIVSDVTGSMYPYTGQLLKWLKLTLTDKVKRHFVFFNDGDNKEDKDKIIGNTGGVYHVLTNNYDEVEAIIEKAMLNGGGGDAPENNIEALIKSDSICVDCDSIVMIADNWAPIKDISLLIKYKKPVKLILCGVLDAINKDYLKLVRETKGSLHLMEEDIYELSKLKNGESIKIHERIYKLIDGEFVEVRKDFS